MSKKVKFDTLRTIGFAAISGVYAAVGSALTENARIICITNNTDGDMIFSDDNTVAAGKFFLARGTFRLLDLTSNMTAHRPSDDFVISKGTIIYVKESVAATKGDVYLEYIYG